MNIVLPKPKSLMHYGLLLMICKVSFESSAILPYNELFDTILSVLSALCLIVYSLMQGYTNQRIIAYSIVICVAVYSVFCTSQFGFLITFLTIIAIAKCDIDEIINFIFSYEILFLVVHTICCLILMAAGKILLYANYYGEIRFNFGFIHPNVFSIYLFNLILMWIWLNYSKLNIWNLIGICLIEVLFFILTRTRTTLIEFFVAVLLILIGKRRENSRLLSCIAAVISPLISIFILVLISNYTRNIPIINFIDGLLSSRIRLGAYGYTNYGITLFGQSINFNVIWDPFWRLNGFTFDCTYSSLWVMQGAVWLVVISIAFYKLAKLRSNKINVMLIVWCLYAITEVHGLNGFKCFPILLIVLLLQNKQERDASYTLKKSIAG